MRAISRAKSFAYFASTGEALYRFLLSQSAKPPSLLLHCRGTHSETRHRHVNYRNRDGTSSVRRESHTETVTDFDFLIDVGQHILPHVTHWSGADSDPLYRGRMVREVEENGIRHKVKGSTRKAFRRWLDERDAAGIPPWHSRTSVVQDGQVFKSSKSLREWADEYCASPKHLKEFVYDKVSRFHGVPYMTLLSSSPQGYLRMEHPAS